MPQIELSKVEPGMILSSDILGPGDKVLITAGSALSARHIEILKNRNIEELEVKEPEIASEDKKIDDEILHTMQQRFRENDSDHPFVKSLQQAWLNKNK